MEVIGFIYDKVYLCIGVMVKWIWIIYLGLIIIEIILLVVGGMNFFDSVCYFLIIIVIGGYLIK